jgi:hypothetical protein
MNDSEQIYIDRENFAIKCSLILMELQEMLEKTKKIENIIIQNMRSQISETDFYQPDLETENEMPCKKRIRK